MTRRSALNSFVSITALNHKCQVHAECLIQLSSVQDDINFVRSEEPICALIRLSKVSIALPLKLFQCSSH